MASTSLKPFTRRIQDSTCFMSSTPIFPPCPCSASIIASAAILPPPKLSVATCVTIFTPGSLHGTSTVNTGMEAAFASWITVTIAFEFVGLSTMAATSFTMKSLI